MWHLSSEECAFPDTLDTTCIPLPSSFILISRNWIWQKRCLRTSSQEIMEFLHTWYFDVTVRMHNILKLFYVSAIYLFMWQQMKSAKRKGILEIKWVVRMINLGLVIWIIESYFVKEFASCAESNLLEMESVVIRNQTRGSLKRNSELLEPMYFAESKFPVDSVSLNWRAIQNYSSQCEKENFRATRVNVHYESKFWQFLVITYRITLTERIKHCVRTKVTDPLTRCTRQFFQLLHKSCRLWRLTGPW